MSDRPTKSEPASHNCVDVAVQLVWALKDADVGGEQAKHQPHQAALQILAGVAARVPGVQLCRTPIWTAASPSPLAATEVASRR